MIHPIMATPLDTRGGGSAGDRGVGCPRCFGRVGGRCGLDGGRPVDGLRGADRRWGRNGVSGLLEGGGWIRRRARRRDRRRDGTIVGGDIGGCGGWWGGLRVL